MYQKGGENPVEEEIIERWIATPCKKTAVPTQTIAKMASARWNIENVGFHDMKAYWYINHPFVHHPTVEGAWMGILVLAVNLL